VLCSRVLRSRAICSRPLLAGCQLQRHFVTNTGKLLLTPGAKQPFELKTETVVLEGASSPEYPLQKKRHSLEYLRTIAHLRPRSNTFSAVFRVRSEAAFAIHEFFHNRRFIYAHTPIITGSDAEGAGEMFRVTTIDIDNPPRTESGEVDHSQDFFGKETNLTVSGQLEAETFALAFGKTYTFGPTFRAENSMYSAGNLLFASRLIFFPSGLTNLVIAPAPIDMIV
jgi:asparaginyl-tRNA synthetase